MMRSRLIPIMLIFVLPMAPAASDSIPYAKPGKDAAVIVGHPALPAQYMFPVEFLTINGRNVVGNRDSIWLEPGKYTITVRMLIRSPLGATARRSSVWRQDDYNQIELVVEAGKVYHVLAKYDPSRVGVPYSTVLHKVTEAD